MTWDAQKYVRGVDSSKESEPNQDRYDRLEAKGLLSKFDPFSITPLVRNTMFSTYTAMVAVTDGVPSKFAQQMEACPCHREMYGLLSDHQRKIFFTHHYGPGWTTCPLASCFAPEMAAWMLDDVLETIWARQEFKLLQAQPLLGAAQMTDDERSILFEDFRIAKGAITAVMLTKNSYWRVLPYFLAILAHSQEDAIARPGVARAIELFNRDPRSEVHDPYTWSLMRPGAKFRADVVAFIGGARRSTLSVSSGVQIGIFKLMPMCETTIEEKYGRMSKPAKANRLGPVKVSLINRMPVIEKKLKRKTLDAWELVSAFDHVRIIKNIPAALGIEDHPDLLSFKRMSASQAVKVLPRVVYRCDRDNLFCRLSRR